MFAYAYGSFLTRRDPRDVDVAVYLGGRGDPWRLAADVAARLERGLGGGPPLDVRSLNGAPPAYAFEVLSRGLVLAERNRDRRLDWEAHAMSRYQDIRPMLDWHDRRYLSR